MPKCIPIAESCIRILVDHYQMDRSALKPNPSQKKKSIEALVAALSAGAPRLPEELRSTFDALNEAGKISEHIEMLKGLLTKKGRASDAHIAAVDSLHSMFTKGMQPLEEQEEAQSYEIGNLRLVLGVAGIQSEANAALVQELQAQNAELQAQNATQAARIRELELMVDPFAHAKAREEMPRRCPDGPKLEIREPWAPSWVTSPATSVAKMEPPEPEEDRKPDIMPELAHLN